VIETKGLRYNKSIRKEVMFLADIKYEILEKIGEISVSPKGWTKELNLISWNDRPGKFDIREWDPEHEKMAKGITLSKEEALKLRELLNTIDF
jgi:hypothetical protein